MTARLPRVRTGGPLSQAPSLAALRLAHGFGWGLLLLSLWLGAWAVPARAAVVASDATSFTIEHRAELPMPPGTVWAALVQWDRWWSPAHTYSGEAQHLDPVAGGLLSERWAGGSVRHAVVLVAMPAKLLRLSGGFGPLQPLPVNAVMDFTLAAERTGTKLVLSYRAAGPASADLTTLAAPVDAVLGEAFARLSSFAVTGKPE